MSLILRIGLIVVSLITLVFITRKVRNAQIKLEDSIFWFCVAGLLFLFSIFPQIFVDASRWAGIMSPANLVFLIFIFILLILGFSLSVHLSQTDTKLKELTQQLAVEKFERYCGDRSLKELSIEEEVIVVVDAKDPSESGESSDR